jgi:hypothetical protein
MEQRYKTYLSHSEWLNLKNEQTPEPLANCYSDVFGGFLDKTEWCYWCTFTTKWELTLPSARRMAEKIYIKFCSRVGQGDLFQCDNPAMFWAAEPFDLRNGFHIHALIRTGAEPKQIYTWAKQKYGRAQVLKYEKGKGAHTYCGKYITKRLSDYDYWM